MRTSEDLDGCQDQPCKGREKHADLSQPGGVPRPHQADQRREHKDGGHSGPGPGPYPLTLRPSDGSADRRDDREEGERPTEPRTRDAVA
jgi:hypothetical protein